MIHLPALGCQPEPDRCWYTTAAASWEPTGLPNGYWDGSGSNFVLQSVPSNNYWVNWLWPTSPETEASTNSCLWQFIWQLDLWETFVLARRISDALCNASPAG